MLSRVARRSLLSSRCAAPSRALSATAPEAKTPLEDAAWTGQFLDATAHLRSDVSYDESAAAIRELVGKELVSYYDLHQNPKRFFEAHRLLARHAVEHGPGFWIRYTVHYNLCYGTVLAVGGPEQVEALAEAQAAKKLGCFALTERFAGVHSGLVVETRADYDHTTKEFVLQTPNDRAVKNWISQGLTADQAVVVADLRTNGVSHGPHAFLMDLRTNGQLAHGVTMGDMGGKTTGNDLDNAWIKFDHVRLPHSALLNKFAQVDADTSEYHQTSKIPAFAMIGQRLFTGRVAVAQAALEYQKKLFEVTRQFTDHKPMWSPFSSRSSDLIADDGPVLSGIPQLKALYEEAEGRTASMESFLQACEDELCHHLSEGTVPSEELSHVIAIAKVKAVGTAIDLCWRLKQEVGSYALMADSGFKHTDFLQCCSFAEGDSRILMQKMARDKFRQFSKGQPLASDEERQLCAALAEGLAPAGKDKQRQQELWDEHWQTVYALAEASMTHSAAEFMRARAAS